MGYFSKQILSISIFFIVLFIHCLLNIDEQSKTTILPEPSLEEALKVWHEMPQQITFIGLKDCLTKFQIYWNATVSCFVGRDCFGNVFTP